MGSCLVSVVSSSRTIAQKDHLYTHTKSDLITSEREREGDRELETGSTGMEQGWRLRLGFEMGVGYGAGGDGNRDEDVDSGGWVKSRWGWRPG